MASYPFTGRHILVARLPNRVPESKVGHFVSNCLKPDRLTVVTKITFISQLKQSCVNFVMPSLLGALISCAPALAQGELEQSRLSDYAYMARLSEAQSKVRQVRIPSEIFISATHEEMLDIAVFDRDGIRLPSGVAPPPAPPAIARQVELKFTTVTAADSARAKNRKTYLIEIGVDASGAPIEILDLHWTHEGSGAPNVELVGIRSRFAGTAFGERALPVKQLHGESLAGGNRTTIRSGGGDMLRLTVLDDASGFQLRRAVGRYTEYQYPPAPRFRVEAVPVFYKGVTYFEFARPSETRPERLSFVAGEGSPGGNGEIHASDDGMQNRRLLNSRIRYYGIDDADDGHGLSPSENWSRYWFVPKQNPRKIYVDLIYRNLVVTFIANGNGPYTLAWGNYLEPTTVDGLTRLDLDLAEAYPPAEMVEMSAIEISGDESRLGGLAVGLSDRQKM